MKGFRSNPELAAVWRAARDLPGARPAPWLVYRVGCAPRAIGVISDVGNVVTAKGGYRADAPGRPSKTFRTAGAAVRWLKQVSH